MKPVWNLLLTISPLFDDIPTFDQLHFSSKPGKSNWYENGISIEGNYKQTFTEILFPFVSTINLQNLKIFDFCKHGQKNTKRFRVKIHKLNVWKKFIILVTSYCFCEVIFKKTRNILFLQYTVKLGYNEHYGTVNICSL
jgi:hypothetical protein